MTFAIAWLSNGYEPEVKGNTTIFTMLCLPLRKSEIKFIEGRCTGSESHDFSNIAQVLSSIPGERSRNGRPPLSTKPTTLASIPI